MKKSARVLLYLRMQSQLKIASGYIPVTTHRLPFASRPEHEPCTAYTPPCSPLLRCRIVRVSSLPTLAHWLSCLCTSQGFHLQRLTCVVLASAAAGKGWKLGQQATVAIEIQIRAAYMESLWFCVKQLTTLCQWWRHAMLQFSCHFMLWALLQLLCCAISLILAYEYITVL